MFAAAPHMAQDVDRAVLLTRVFLEGLNARDVDGLATLVSNDVEFRNASGGRSLHGREALEVIVRVAKEENVRIVRRDSEEITSHDGELRIAVPVLELASGAEIPGMAIFDVRDDKIVAFEVTSEQLRR
jgi:SnoaL-like domain